MYQEAEVLFQEVMEINRDVLGKEHPDYLKTLSSLANLFRAQGKYKDAEPLLKEAKEIREMVLGKEHPEYAQSLINLAGLYQAQSEYKDAELLLQEAMEIRKKVFGKEHQDYARVIKNLADLYRSQGLYERAEQLYFEAKEILEKVLGKEHPDYAQSLNNLAILYYYTSKYDSAEVYFQESKQIRERVLGKEHPSYAQSIGNLAALYVAQSRFEEAEPLYLEAKEIQEKIFGLEHPSYASNLDNLAILYENQGRYKKAEEIYREVLEIRERVLGKEHIEYAVSLNNLAMLYRTQNRLGEAEQLLLKSIEIQQKKLRKDHPFYLASINNLASIYEARGQFEEAEKRYQIVRETWEEVGKRNHQDYASNLNNLAIIYKKQGHYRKAEKLYLEAKAIREKIFGQEHPSYAMSLNNIAVLFNAQERYEEAEKFHLEAKAIREKIFGTEHPDYASTLNNLAFLYKNQRRFNEAETFFLRAKKIREQILGKNHPDYELTLNGMAGLYETLGRYEEAMLFFRKVSGIQQQMLVEATKYMSEQELETYTSFFYNRMAESSSYSLKSYPSLPSVANLLFDNALFYKGFLFESVIDLRHTVQSSQESIQDIYDKWKGLHRRLVKQYSKPLDERQNIEELENRANDLEKQLTRLVAGFSEARRQVTWEEVRDQLQEDEAAVEFTHFRYRDTIWTDSVMYCALVLRPGYEYPRLVPLFEEGQIEGLFRIDSDNRQDQVTQLYASRDRDATRGAGLANKGQYPDLYRLAWQPLDSLLQGVERVYYAPSGLLHRLSFPAIRVDSSTFLSDRYQLQQTSSTRSLVVRGRENSTPTQTAALFGDITYRTDSTALAEGRDTTRITETYSKSVVARGTAPEIKRVQSGPCHWSPSPGTYKELNGLLPLFSEKEISTKVYRQYKASEEAFKRIGEEAPSPDILHVATHGYFAPDPKQREEEDEMSLSGQPAFRFSEQPLLRSGLILAGADTAWCTGVGLANLEDGILTAYEISQMDLSNTKLAVLSACDTGLGDIKGSEGVYGLQRAFRMAGVNYLLLSLWPVADSKETIEFMETFYRNWLSGMPIRDAFDETQRAMRAKYSAPYYWAGFVLID